MVEPLPAEKERWIAALAYLWITGLVFLFLRRFRDSPYVRFHCLQAVFFGLAALVLNQMLAWLARLMGPSGSALLIFGTIWGLVRLGFFLIWVLVIVKAYQGLEYKLPAIGGLAWKYSR